MSELNNDFDSLVEQINAKLNEAATAMKEVNNLRRKAGLESLIFSQWEREEAYRKISREVNESEEAEDPDFDEDEVVQTKMEELQAKYDIIDTNALERELNQAGWSTSSSYC
jgi:hypothetical protein